MELGYIHPGWIVAKPDRAPWLDVSWQTTLSQKAVGTAPFPGPVPPKSLLSSLKMNTDQSTLPHKAHCDACGQSTSGYDIVHYGSIERGYRRLCSRCFNTQMAKAAGLERFEPV